ncbi:hypothetical protein EYF80_032808 [Liparis tanakae]|uniref:Uncharacterized protein n=1 Tax=Liparis tanakae TaxID=230148 RepID=A0A4Z2GTQ8_9TELE|nr:hypothetical protein EYF80_032808 [Liparis tanakae]
MVQFLKKDPTEETSSKKQLMKEESMNVTDLILIPMNLGGGGGETEDIVTHIKDRGSMVNITAALCAVGGVTDGAEAREAPGLGALQRLFLMNPFVRGSRLSGGESVECVWYLSFRKAPFLWIWFSSVKLKVKSSMRSLVWIFTLEA